MTKIAGIIFFIIVVTYIIGCENSFTPKPRGYYRIDLPPKKYKPLNLNYPYHFQYPDYAIIKPDTNKRSEPYWINIQYPQLNGTIHISYKKINNNLETLTEDSRSFAYKHAIKANAINEMVVSDKERKLYGILYEIKGNAASSVQFYLTDSIQNFLRGSLYFYTHPNSDSLSPVIEFCREDIDHLIKTFEWIN